MRKRVKDDMLTWPQASPECAGSGWIPAWNVANRYVIEKGLLIEIDDADSRDYNPFSEVNLPADLARIAAGELSPVEFASEYGLLGYDRLRLPDRETGGDPVDWVSAHSRTVALCLKLAGLLEQGDDTELEYELVEMTSGPYARGTRMVGLPTDYIRRALKRHASASGLARFYLSSIINENITGISRNLQPDLHRTRIASFFTFRAMIETVYWQLADRLENGGVRRCLECRRFFVARDKRQQYCPAFPGSTRSRCSSNLNVKNFRSRSKGNI